MYITLYMLLPSALLHLDGSMLSSLPIELQIKAGPPHTVQAAPWLCITAKRTSLPVPQCTKEKRDVLKLQRGPI